jgi:hypothetical protein
MWGDGYDAVRVGEWMSGEWVKGLESCVGHDNSWAGTGRAAPACYAHSHFYMPPRPLTVFSQNMFPEISPLSVKLSHSRKIPQDP